MALQVEADIVHCDSMQKSGAEWDQSSCRDAPRNFSYLDPWLLDSWSNLVSETLALSEIPVYVYLLRWLEGMSTSFISQ